MVPAAALALVVLLAAAGPLTGSAPQPTPGILNLQDVLLADPADSPASCEHVDYGERDGLYDRLSYARDLIPLWHAYLAGEFSLDQTIERIVDHVVKAERRIDSDR